MARITVSKEIDPVSIRQALGGIDVMLSAGDEPYLSGPVDVIADVDEATLQAAIDASSPPKTPDDELRAAIEAATTLDELKAALLGTNRPARVVGRAT